MKITELALQLKPGSKIANEQGFTAIVDDEGMLTCYDGEPFGFYIEELLSNGWELLKEENE